MVGISHLLSVHPSVPFRRDNKKRRRNTKKKKEKERERERERKSDVKCSGIHPAESERHLQAVNFLSFYSNFVVGSSNCDSVICFWGSNNSQETQQQQQQHQQHQQHQQQQQQQENGSDMRNIKGKEEAKKERKWRGDESDEWETIHQSDSVKIIEERARRRKKVRKRRQHTEKKRLTLFCFLLCACV